jgi:hypothetical protein
MSSKRACSPGIGKEMGRLYIFLEIFSTTESTFRVADGERKIMQ